MRKTGKIFKNNKNLTQNQASKYNKKNKCHKIQVHYILPSKKWWKFLVHDFFGHQQKSKI